MAARTPSPFETLDRTFTALVTGPDPLALDGRSVGHGLPARLIPLDELRAMLLHPSVGFQARDAALAALVRRAKREGGAATVGLAGVLLPGLRRATGPLAAACPGRVHDLEAEALAGLLEAVTTMPEAIERVAAWLVWRAVRAAHRLLETERAWRTRTQPPVASAAPPRPAGHPDLVLADAVRDGVVSARDAELVGETRIGGVRLCDLARRWGQPYKTLAKRRDRAEDALVAWLLGTRMSNSGA
jgi:hypothetical protein